MTEPVASNPSVRSGLTLLAENCEDSVLLLDDERVILEVNDGAVEQYGIDRRELIGCRYDDLLSDTTPLGGEGAAEGEAEEEHRTKDGLTFRVRVQWRPMVLAGQQLTVCIVRSLCECGRKESFAEMMCDVNLSILQGKPVEETLQLLCERLASNWSFPLVQVGLKGSDGRVDVRVYSGRAASFLNDITVRWDESEAGMGPTGTAIRTGEIQIRDLHQDPHFEMWLDDAVRYDLRSAVAIPLVGQLGVMGALTVFSARSDHFGDPTVSLLRNFANQVAISLQAARDQDQIQLGTIALNAAANAVVITDVGGVIEWVNPAFTTLTGYEREEVCGRTPSLLKSGKHSTKFYARMWSTLARGDVWQGEIFNRRKDGSIYLESQTITPVRTAGGEITHFVAIKEDISTHREQEARIHHLSLHDPLTNLPNRQALDGALQRMLSESTEELPGALLVLDIDNFKPVNDALGHREGDRFLSEISSLLRKSIRPGDFASRIGGDEFAILIERTDRDGVETIAETLLEAVRRFHFEAGAEIHDVTASIGICFAEKQSDAQTMMVRADSALFASKERGDTVTVYPGEGDKGFWLTEESRWGSKIKGALRDDAFDIHFQPVVKMDDGRTLHYEALVRIRESDGRLALPGEFLSAASRFGLLPQIDRRVLSHVIEIARSHPGQRVFVNLSPESLALDSFLDDVEQMVRTSGLEPGQIAFEITESSAVQDFAKVQSWIRDLKAIGCSFALDDFGIGFSSFAYLRALSVDYVKIDRSFVKDLDTNATNRALVTAVKSVADTLGKEVIAEGVETEELRDVLMDLGIVNGQGYYWGRPSFGMERAGDREGESMSSWRENA